MFIDYRKLFAHLLSNFDLDLYKSILFIVISKIIKYTFFEIRFLEFTFRISFFPKYSLVEYLLFQKKKKGRNSFLRIWQLNASNIDSLIFRRGGKETANSTNYYYIILDIRNCSFRDMKIWPGRLMNSNQCRSEIISRNCGILYRTSIISLLPTCPIN